MSFEIVLRCHSV